MHLSILHVTRDFFPEYRRLRLPARDGDDSRRVYSGRRVYRYAIDAEYERGRRDWQAESDYQTPSRLTRLVVMYVCIVTM